MNQTDTTLTDIQTAAIYGGSAESTATSENQETSENSEGSESSESTRSLTKLLAEAEQRGYLRGRNEAAEEMMNRPTMWQPLEAQSAGHRIAAAADSFLSGLRPGVWD